MWHRRRAAGRLKCAERLLIGGKRGASIKHPIQARLDAVARRPLAPQPGYWGIPVRVASVDALRGFTMFWIIGADGAAKALAEMLSGMGTIPSAAGNVIARQPPDELGSRPRARGLARRDARPFRPCHANARCSSLGRGHQYACGPPSLPKQAPATQRARQPALRGDVTLSWRFGSLSCGRNGGRLALPTLARAGATLTCAAAKTVVVPSTLRTRKAEGQNQLRPSTRAVEGFAGVWVTIRACGEVGFRLTAEAEIGRGRFADGPSAVLSIEFQHAVGGGCAVRDLGFRFFAHVLPSSSGRPPARSRNVVLGWW